MLQTTKIKTLYGFAAQKLISNQDRESMVGKYTAPGKKDKPAKPAVREANR